MRPVRTRLRLIKCQPASRHAAKVPLGVKTVPSVKSRTGGITRPTVLCEEELLLYLLWNIVQGEITTIVNDHLRDVAEKPPPKGGKSHDQCWYLENPIFVLLQRNSTDWLWIVIN